MSEDTICAIQSCKNKGKIPGITYFQVTPERKQWLLNVPIKSIPENERCVCSDHFRNDCLNLSSVPKSLVLGAAPSLYLWSAKPNVVLTKSSNDVFLLEDDNWLKLHKSGAVEMHEIKCEEPVVVRRIESGGTNIQQECVVFKPCTSITLPRHITPDPLSMTAANKPQPIHVRPAQPFNKPAQTQRKLSREEIVNHDHFYWTNPTIMQVKLDAANRQLASLHKERKVLQETSNRLLSSVKTLQDVLRRLKKAEKK